MKINFIGIESPTLTSEIEKQTDETGKEVFFIEWNSSPSFKDMIDSIPVDVPMIIFDRYCKITPEDQLYLNSRNSVLMEPVINHRNGFIFHPYWMELELPDYEIFLKKRNNKVFDIGYSKHNPNIDVIDTLIDIDKLGEYDICLDCKFNNDEYKLLNKLFHIGSVDYMDCNISIVESTKHGMIPPDLNSIIKCCSLPVIFKGGYLLYGMFYPHTIESVSDLKWFVEMYPYIGYSMIEDLINRIKECMPEAEVNNFVTDIISMFNKM